MFIVLGNICLMFVADKKREIKKSKLIGKEEATNGKKHKKEIEDRKARKAEEKKIN